MTNFVFRDASDSIARNQPLGALVVHFRSHRCDTTMPILPLGRFGNAEDMAGLVLFFVSKASRHVNGAAIPLDGGTFIHGRQVRVDLETKSKL